MSLPFTTRLVHLNELDRALDLCLEAFADEVVTRWATPHHANRREQFEESLEAAVNAQEMMVAVSSEGQFAAASFWHHLDTEQIKAMKAESTISASMPTDPAGRITTATALTAARPPAAPHSCLSSTATPPAQRGQGAGSVMHHSAISYAVSRALPIYREATTPPTRTLYLRKGFIDHGQPIAPPQPGP